MENGVKIIDLFVQVRFVIVNMKGFLTRTNLTLTKKSGILAPFSIL